MAVEFGQWVGKVRLIHRGHDRIMFPERRASAVTGHLAETIQLLSVDVLFVYYVQRFGANYNPVDEGSRSRSSSVVRQTLFTTATRRFALCR
jgi:hypothetical protein